MELSGKGVETDDEEPDEDSDELDNINGCNGFAGIPKDEITRNNKIRKSTNITAV